jgi:uncharacterized protein (DUF433 family)
MRPPFLIGYWILALPAQTQRLYHLFGKIIGQFMTTDRIEIYPKVMMGKPVIKGTRIKVELVLRKLAEGATEDDLLDAYPRLTREDIRAALAGPERIA